MRGHLTQRAVHSAGSVRCTTPRCAGTQNLSCLRTAASSWTVLRCVTAAACVPYATVIPPLSLLQEWLPVVGIPEIVAAYWLPPAAEAAAST